MYTRINFQDHSYAYGNSAYADPPAHKKQKEADGAYKHRKVRVTRTPKQSPAEGR